MDDFTDSIYCFVDKHEVTDNEISTYISDNYYWLIVGSHGTSLPDGAHNLAFLHRLR